MTNTTEQSPKTEMTTVEVTTTDQPLKAELTEPIPTPGQPKQYRAIGLLWGRYVPQQPGEIERGTLITGDGTHIDAVVLGKLLGLVRSRYVDLEKEHLWVVYPRTRGMNEKSDESDANLRGAVLSRANLYHAKLRNSSLADAKLDNANLYQANLSDADLEGADLTKANLAQADLENTNLGNANLSSAFLVGGRLISTNLVEANLSNANLKDTTLKQANLSKARLDGANLTGATLCNYKKSKCANLDGASLNQVIGLEQN